MGCLCWFAGASSGPGARAGRGRALRDRRGRGAAEGRRDGRPPAGGARDAGRTGRRLVAPDEDQASPAADRASRPRDRAASERGAREQGAAGATEQRIAAARVALGSVAQRPWRLTAAEAELPGNPLTREALIPVIERAMADAEPLPQNGFKVTMARNAAVRALLTAGGAS